MRFLHWDVNVDDLEASVEFYELLTTFRAAEPVTAADGSYRSRTLRNTNEAAPLPTLTLVQELHPVPAGRPHATQLSVGFFRVVFHVENLDDTRRVATAAGFVPFAPTTGDDFRFTLGSVGPRAYRVFAVHDPNSVVVEFIENPSPKLSTVAQGTRSFDEGHSFYTDALGLELVDTVATIGPTPNIYVPHGEPIEFRGGFYRAPDDERGYLDVLEHVGVPGDARAYDSPHHVGVIRCVFEVDDLDSARAAVTSADAGLVVGQPRWEALGGSLGRRRILDLQDREGVAYRLVEGLPGP